MAHRKYEYQIPEEYKHSSNQDLAYNQFKRTKSGYVAIVYRFNNDDSCPPNERKENLTLYYFDNTEKTSLINTMVEIDDRCKIDGNKWVVYSFAEDLSDQYMSLPSNDNNSYDISMRMLNMTTPMIDIINMARSIKKLM